MKEAFIWMTILSSSQSSSKCMQQQTANVPVQRTIILSKGKEKTGIAERPTGDATIIQDFAKSINIGVTEMLFNPNWRNLKKEFENRRPEVTDLFDREIVAAKAKRFAEKALQRTPDGVWQRQELQEGAEYCLMALFQQGYLTQDKCEVMPGSKYDDFENGADLVVYLKAGCFSVDVKAGLEEESMNVQEKVALITKKIGNGISPIVKYGNHKRLEEMPNFVVYFEPFFVKGAIYLLSKKRDEGEETILQKIAGQIKGNMTELVDKISKIEIGSVATRNLVTQYKNVTACLSI